MECRRELNISSRSRMKYEQRTRRQFRLFARDEKLVSRKQFSWGFIARIKSVPGMKREATIDEKENQNCSIFITCSFVRMNWPERSRKGLNFHVAK